MTVPTWPISWSDIIGSITVLLLAAYAIILAFKIKGAKVTDVFANYIFMLTMVIGVFALSRSCGHLAKQILILNDNPNAWAALSPFSGAANTLTFVVIFAFSIYFEKVGQQKKLLDRAAIKLSASQAKINTVRESKLRVQTIFDGMEDAVYVVDKQFRILFYNRKMQELFPALTEKHTCYKLIMGRNSPCEECELQTVLNSNHRVLRKFSFAGIDRKFNLLELALTWIDGSPVKLNVARDITDHRDLEAQLVHAQKMEAIGTLAGGLAHDINNMLTPILGHTELAKLKLGKDDPALRRFAEIEKCALRASALIKQVLTFSRRQILNKNVIDLNSVVIKITDMLKHLVEENIELELHLAGNLWHINADTGQIEQILTNLTINARDAMPKGGTLSIATKNNESFNGLCDSCGKKIAGNFVSITVTDNGIGMNEEVSRRIFEPFFTTKNSSKGTGLGLSMVDGIIHQHHGHTNLRSKEGVGSTFIIFLPAEEQLPEVEFASTEPEPVAEVPAMGSETILVVEDNDDVLAFTTECLRELGYTILEFNNPIKALAEFRKNPGAINMILTDVVMGGKTGRELVLEARQRNPEIRSLFMSGYTDNIIAQHGVLEKGVHFLSKPFSTSELADKIRKCLDSEAEIWQ